MEAVLCSVISLLSEQYQTMDAVLWLCSLIIRPRLTFGEAFAGIYTEQVRVELFTGLNCLQVEEESEEGSEEETEEETEEGSEEEEEDEDYTDDDVIIEGEEQLEEERQSGDGEVSLLFP